MSKYAELSEQGKEVRRRASRKYYRAHHAEVIAKAAVYYRANQEQLNAWARQRRAAMPKLYAGQRRQRIHGVSPEQFREMLIGQAGRCLICGLVPPRELRLDHSHATGKVRGLLCEHCNLAVGHLRDDPQRAASAARYLATPS